MVMSLVFPYTMKVVQVPDDLIHHLYTMAGATRGPDIRKGTYKLKCLGTSLIRSYFAEYIYGTIFHTYDLKHFGPLKKEDFDSIESFKLIHYVAHVMDAFRSLYSIATYHDIIDKVSNKDRKLIKCYYELWTYIYTYCNASEEILKERMWDTLCKLYASIQRTVAHDMEVVK